MREIESTNTRSRYIERLANRSMRRFRRFLRRNPFLITEEEEMVRGIIWHLFTRTYQILSAVVRLSRQSCGHEAYILTRTSVEILISLEWMMANNPEDEVRKYIDHGMYRQAIGGERALTHRDLKGWMDDPVLRKSFQTQQEHKAEFLQRRGRGERKHWSGIDLPELCKKLDELFGGKSPGGEVSGIYTEYYLTLYIQSSSYVHVDGWTLLQSQFKTDQYKYQNIAPEPYWAGTSVEMCYASFLGALIHAAKFGGEKWEKFAQKENHRYISRSRPR